MGPLQARIHIWRFRNGSCGEVRLGARICPYFKRGRPKNKLASGRRTTIDTYPCAPLSPASGSPRSLFLSDPRSRLLALGPRLSFLLPSRPLLSLRFIRCPSIPPSLFALDRADTRYGNPSILHSLASFSAVFEESSVWFSRDPC